MLVLVQKTKIWIYNFMLSVRMDANAFFTDTVSGAKSVRPGLDKILKAARPKDVIVIWKLDRLG